MRNKIIRNFGERVGNYFLGLKDLRDYKGKTEEFLIENGNSRNIYESSYYLLSSKKYDGFLSSFPFAALETASGLIMLLNSALSPKPLKDPENLSCLVVCSTAIILLKSFRKYFNGRLKKDIEDFENKLYALHKT